MKFLYLILIIPYVANILHGKIIEQDELSLYLIQNFRVADNTGIIPDGTGSFYQGKSYTLILIGMGLKYSLNKDFLIDASFKTLPSNIAVGTHTSPYAFFRDSEIISFNEYGIGILYRYLVNKNLITNIATGMDYTKTTFNPYPEGLPSDAWSAYSSIFFKIGMEYSFGERKTTIGVNLKYNNKDKIEYTQFQRNKINVTTNPISFETVFSYYFD